MVDMSRNPLQILNERGAVGSYGSGVKTREEAVNCSGSILTGSTAKSILCFLMGDALCKHNRSFGRQSLKDVEGFNSMNAPKIAPLCGDYFTGLETFNLPGAIFDQLIELIHRNDV